MGIAIIVGVMIWLAIMLVFVGLGRTLEAVDADRLEQYLGDQQMVGGGLRSSERPAGLVASVLELTRGFDKILRSVATFEQLARLLRQADLKLTVTEYLFFWLLSVIGAATGAYIIGGGNLLPVVVSAVLGAGAPYFFLHYRRRARIHAFNDQLAGILMQLAGSMRAGYGLLMAIDFVAQETPPPAGPELAQVVRDARLGSTLIEALDDLTERVGSDDLMLIVTAIRIHYETGGNLAEILDTVAETIRERVRIKGELQSLTAQQRYSGYVLAALPIFLFFVLMLLNPEYESRLFMPGPTLCIPIGAGVCMLLGFLAIRFIVSIEV